VCVRSDSSAEYSQSSGDRDKRATPDLNSPGGRWSAARELDPTGEFEWTFPLFALRAVALRAEVGPDENRGLDVVYEPVHEWSDLQFILGLRDALYSTGHSDNMVPQAQLGLELFDGAYSAPLGKLVLPAKDEKFRGRHSVGTLDIFGPGTLRFQNSWGGSWGDGGAGYLSKAYFNRHCDSIWVSRAAWLGPSAAMDRAARAASADGRPNAAHVVTLWHTPNRAAAKEIDCRGATLHVRLRSLNSISGEMGGLQVLDVRSHNTILGRCHVRHLARHRTIVEEMFVRPTHRLRGVGSALEGLAVDLARRAGSHRLEAYLHEADATADGTEAAERFACARGYVLGNSVMRRPNVRKIGTKVLDRA
jgi:GNAT superfamily N-acetyltransferase